MRILLVEDNDELANFICTRFAALGHVVDHASTGGGGLTLAAQYAPDTIILDRMLPGDLEGLAVIERLRASGCSAPVLILSALGDVDEKVRGLRAGGDDYVTKPFAIDELVARVEVLSRRTPQTPPAPILRVADLVMDLATRQVSRDDRPITLRPREFRLLEYLMRHAGQIVTRAMLLEHVWKFNFDPETNVIDVQISKLRTKIDDASDKPLIRTIRTVGYMLKAHD